MTRFIYTAAYCLFAMLCAAASFAMLDSAIALLDHGDTGLGVLSIIFMVLAAICAGLSIDLAYFASRRR